ATFSATPRLTTTAGMTLTAITSTSMKLSWSVLNNATGYNIMRSTDGTNFSQIATINSGATVTYTDSTLSPLTNYYYYAQGFNADTTGIPSTPVFASTLATAPLPAPFSQMDIGTVSGPGQAGYNAATGTYTFNTSGQDIAGTSDSFHFVYFPVTSDT